MCRRIPYSWIGASHWEVTTRNVLIELSQDLSKREIHLFEVVVLCSIFAAPTIS